MKLTAGQVFDISYPFIRDTFTELDEDGTAEVSTWVPGVRMESKDPNACDVADAIGWQILTVVSTHKPGTFPERVFYTRKWRDPSGKVFGKNSLHVRSVAQFTALTRGYRHRFEITGAVPQEAA